MKTIQCFFSSIIFVLFLTLSLTACKDTSEEKSSGSASSTSTPETSFPGTFSVMPGES